MRGSNAATLITSKLGDILPSSYIHVARRRTYVCTYTQPVSRKERTIEYENTRRESPLVLPRRRTNERHGLATEPTGNRKPAISISVHRLDVPRLNRRRVDAANYSQSFPLLSPVWLFYPPPPPRLFCSNFSPLSSSLFFSFYCRLFCSFFFCFVFCEVARQINHGNRETQ